ncbi:MAG: hypothetical protein ACR2QS_09600 [Woeseiaceae bacterium]
MAALNRLSRLLLVALLIAAGITGPTRAAESLELGAEGWHTWRVASVDDFEEEQFFVLMRSNEVKKIHIVGRWCNGWSWKRSERNYPEAVDLGFVETEQSIDWFQPYIGKRTELSSDALAAISQHAGERAVQIMIEVVESDAPMDVREKAVFWMAQSGSQEAFAYIDRLLMLD